MSLIQLTAWQPASTVPVPDRICQLSTTRADLCRRRSHESPPHQAFVQEYVPKVPKGAHCRWTLSGASVLPALLLPLAQAQVLVTLYQVS